jgi:hypothetical protein
MAVSKMRETVFCEMDEITIRSPVQALWVAKILQLTRLSARLAPVTEKPVSQDLATLTDFESEDGRYILRQ